MAFVGLSIVEPKNAAAFTGVTAVNFKGALSPLPAEVSNVTLYYRWYSSLNGDVKKGKYSMNANALASANAVHTQQAMGMGSHVITFAVSDRQGEKDEDFQAMRHGGVTGGEEGASRCVIHVFKANILDPQNGASVSRANLVLFAEAPSVWSDDHYHAYNRLGYRWLLEPTGAPTGRPTFDSGKLTRQQVSFFDGDGTKLPRVSYQPGLSVQVTGNYKITLSVEDALGQGIGSHQASVNVSLT